MSDLERLGDEPRRELARFEPGPGLLALVAAWPEAAGPEIARNAWPARMARDGTLHVATRSSAWAFELTHLEGSLVARLAELVGEGAPKKLRFAPGPLPSPAAQKPDAATRRPRTTGAKARSEAAAITAPIEDEELREMVARAAAASLERAAADRSV